MLKNNKNMNISPWWVTGITDGEGNFSLNITVKNKKINASFKVTQKGHSLSILVGLKNYFNCGNINIDNKKFGAYKYVVSSRSDIMNKIIPHFDKYPLVGSKELDFLDFKKGISLLSDSSENFDKIYDIKSKMNKSRSYEERWNYLKDLKLNLQPEWVQAFIDGEGCFQCRIAHVTLNNRNYISVNPTLEIAQNSHEIKVLYAIKDFFKVGYLKPKYDINSLIESKESRSVNRLVINQYDVIINFFDKYPLFTLKRLDFSDWKHIISLKLNKAYESSEGYEEMLSIKKGMNTGRLLNSSSRIPAGDREIYPRIPEGDRVS